RRAGARLEAARHVRGDRDRDGGRHRHFAVPDLDGHLLRPHRRRAGTLFPPAAAGRADALLASGAAVADRREDDRRRLHDREPRRVHRRDAEVLLVIGASPRWLLLALLLALV